VLNGHSSGSDGPMATELKRYNGGRVLVFVMGPSAEMSGDMSRICDIIAHDLARTTSRTTTTIPSAPRACTGSTFKRPGGTRRTAAGPISSSLLDRARDLFTHGPAHRGASSVEKLHGVDRRGRPATRMASSSLITPRRGLLPRLGGAASVICCRCLDPIRPAAPQKNPAAALTFL